MFVCHDDAVVHLLQSQPVAIPTETVWGLAARLGDEQAIKSIFKLKGRPPQNPLIIHVSSLDMVYDYVSVVPDEVHALTQTFWPGGLSLVLPVKTEKIPALVRAELVTAAFRMPDNTDTLSLINTLGPLVAPSANLSGSPSATLPQHIEQDFGASLPILKTQSHCQYGIESTILIWKEGTWLLGRPGAINLPDIQKVLGYKPSCYLGPHPICPGQLFRHYAPQAKLFLQSSGWDPKKASLYDAVLGFSDRKYPRAQKVITMGSSLSPASVAHSLYASLRELDYHRLQSVFVDINVHTNQEWDPIFDRLQRAAE